MAYSYVQVVFISVTKIRYIISIRNGDAHAHCCIKFVPGYVFSIADYFKAYIAINGLFPLRNIIKIWLILQGQQLMFSVVRQL